MPSPSTALRRAYYVELCNMYTSVSDPPVPFGVMYASRFYYRLLRNVAWFVSTLFPQRFLFCVSFEFSALPPAALGQFVGRGLALRRS